MRGKFFGEVCIACSRDLGSVPDSSVSDRKNVIRLCGKKLRGGKRKAWVLRFAQDDDLLLMDKVFLLLFVHKKKSLAFLLYVAAIFPQQFDHGFRRHIAFGVRLSDAVYQHERQLPVAHFLVSAHVADEAFGGEAAVEVG